MDTLGEAVIEVRADTKLLKGDVYKSAKTMDKEGQVGGKSFVKGFNQETGPNSFSQLHFSFAKVAVKAGLFLSTMVPIPSALAGIVAGAVAVTGAVGQASGSLLSFSAAASSLGLGAITAVVALGGMKDAVKAQSKALQELRREGKVSEATQSALDDTMKRLAPSARAVAKELAELAPAWLEFRQSIQGKFFEGVADQLGNISKSLLPIFTKQLGDTAGLLNTAAKGIGNFLSSAEGTEQINSLLAGLNTSLRSLLPAIGNIGKGLLTLFVGSTGSASYLSNTILGLSERFAEWAKQITESGEFQDFLRDASTAAGALIGVLTNVGQILGIVFGAGADEGVSMLQTFKDATQRLEDFLSSADGQNGLDKFFDLIAVSAQAAKDIFSVLGPIIAGIGDVFTALIPGIEALRAAFLPIYQELSQKIGKALTDLVPKVSEIVELFKGLLPVLAPIVKFFAGVFISAVIGAVNGALNVIKGLLTVITGVVNVVKGIFTGDWALAWEGMKQIVSGALTALWGVIQVLWNIGVIGLFRKGLAVLKGLWSGFWTGLKALPGLTFTAIKNSVFGFFSSVKLAFQYAFQAYGSVVKAGWQVIKDVFSFALGAIRGAVTKAFNAIRGFISGVMGGIRSNLVSGFSNIISFLGGLPGRIGGIAGKFVDAGKKLGKSVIDGMTAGLKKTGGFLADIGNAIRGKINSVLGLPRTIGKGPLKFTIPAFARGTDFAPGGMALVGERGPELVNIPRGSSVHTNSQTTSLLASPDGPTDLSDETLMKLAAMIANAILTGATRVVNANNLDIANEVGNG